MTISMLLVLGILLAAVVVFVTGWLRADLVALLVLLSLGLSGVLTPQETLGSFGRSAVVIICAAFVLTGALDHTGVSQALGGLLLRVVGEREWRLVAATSTTAALLSLVMNNIAAGAVLMPAVVTACRRLRISPARVLLPMAIATQLGGMATLLTTSNIVAASVLRDQGVASFGLLDFLPVGGPVALAGLAYLVLIGRRLLPEHSPVEAALQPRRSLTELYDLQRDLQPVLVTPASPLVGLSLVASNLGARYGYRVVALDRPGARVTRAPLPDMVVQAHDHLILQGPPLRADLAQSLGLAPSNPIDVPLAGEATGLFEAVVAPRSGLAGKTLRATMFREKYGFSVLAIWRAGTPMRAGLADQSLQFGDALLLQGPRARLSLLGADNDLIVLAEGEGPPLRTRRRPLALAILAVTLVVAATGLVPIAETLLVGALMCVVTGCLSMDEAYASIEWRAVFLVGGMLPMGVALTKTGAAALMGHWLIATMGGYGPLGLLAGLFVFTVVLTQIIPGGSATPLVVAPIAFSAAQVAGVDPRAFVMAVALATSTSILTPFAHPVNVLVMGPGGYQLRDYLRVGLPLVLLMFVLVMLLLPQVWPVS